MHSAAPAVAPPPPAGLILLAPAGLAGLAAIDPCARLAALLGLRLLEPPALPAIGPGDDPAAVLAALAQQPPGWLLPLPLDPGEPLQAPGCWADALAAWRQPALLLLHAGWPPAGAPRAYHALLAGAGVPLLGLVQLGGPWQPQPRRGDGLPWLGWLPAPADRGGEPEAAAAAEDALRELVLRRWRGLSAARPHPHPSDPPS